MKKIKAYSYVRISSKGQIDGRGISRQLAAAKDYADKHGLELDEQLADVGKSGFHGHHVKFGALGGFLKLVEDKQIAPGSFLLVEALDRLSREDVLIAQQQLIALLVAGINVVTLIDNQTYHKDRDFTQLILSLSLMKTANDESLKKSVRIKDVYRQRKLDALAGKPRYNHQMFGWIDQTRIEGTQDFKFSLNDKAKAIQRIFELADSGLGAWSIARTLNEECYPVLRAATNVDGRWKDAQVQALLRNETVIGTYTAMETIDGKRVPMGPPIKNYYPAAVSEELFWRVQRNRHKPKANGALGRRYTNLFSRNTSCSECGRVLRLSRGGAKGRYKLYYSCMQKAIKGDHACSGKFYPYNPLEEAVLTYATDFYDAAAAELNVPETNRAKLEKQLTDARGYMETLSKRRENLRLLAQEDLPPEDKADFLKDIRGLREKIEQQNAFITETERQIADANNKRGEIKSVLQRINEERAKWPFGTDQEVYESRSKVAQMLREFITTIEIDFPKQEAIVWVGGFTSAYKFDRNGSLIGHVNILPMLIKTDTRTLIDRTPSGRVRSIRTHKAEADQPTMAEDMMIETMQGMGWREDRIALAIKASKRIADAAG